MVCRSSKLTELNVDSRRNDRIFFNLLTTLDVATQASNKFHTFVFSGELASFILATWPSLHIYQIGVK